MQFRGSYNGGGHDIEFFDKIGDVVRKGVLDIATMLPLKKGGTKKLKAYTEVEFDEDGLVLRYYNMN